MSVIALAIFLGAAASQPAGDIFGILEEEERVTTGSRVATKVSESPSSVFVLTRQQIEDTAAMTIPDLLRRIPGLDILELVTGDDFIASRGTGGETSSHMLYMIDGRSVLGDFYNTTDVNGLPIDINDIERIEVVLGPASTLYGTNAFLGVVNFITRDPVTTGYRVRADFRGGTEWTADNKKSYGAPGALGKGYAEYSQAFGKLRLRASFGATYIDTEHSTDTDPLTAPEALRRMNGMADLIYDTGDWNLRAQFTGGIKKSLGLVTLISTPTKETWEDYAVSFTAKREHLGGSDGELSLQAWARRNTFENYVAISGIPTSDVSAGTWTGEFTAQYSSPTFYKNRVLTGLQSRVFDVEAIGVLPSARTQGIVGLFLQDQFRPWEPLIFTAGVRVENREAGVYPTLQHWDVAPRGAIVYIPAPGHSLRAEVTTAYRDPSVFEGFQQVGNDAFTVVVPNPALKPEQNVMGQIGYQGHIGWFKPRVEGFVGDKLNMITLQASTLDALPLHYDNTSDTEYYGVTAYASATPWQPLELFAQYTFYEARPENAKGVFAPYSGHVYMTAPGQSGGGGGTLTLGRFTASLQMYLTGESAQYDLIEGNTIAIQGRFIINALVRYAVDAEQRFRIYVAGTNLVNAHFGAGYSIDTQNTATEQIGPRVWAGVDFSLPR